MDELQQSRRGSIDDGAFLYNAPLPFVPLSMPTKRNLDTCPEPEKITIQREVKNIDDLLRLIDDYPSTPQYEYNININMLHEIKEPLQELNAMVGIKDLKESIVNQTIYFIQDLHKNKENKETGDYMHTVIYGPPGTGKTEVARIMGKLYSRMGLLKKGVFQKVTRSDLIAGYLGQTAIKTTDVIKQCLGGVLFIDEAYALGNPDKKDSFSKECIDTLCEALSFHKDNLMVIIAGYESELKDCFFSYNQGLESRFPWRFKTDAYSGLELFRIFKKQVHHIGWSLLQENLASWEPWFEKRCPDFRFYGRDMESLLFKVKIAHSRRVFCQKESERKIITLDDLEKGFQVFIKQEEKDKKKQQEFLISTMYV